MVLCCSNFHQRFWGWLLSFRQLTACMVAECIFGDSFLVDFLDNFFGKILYNVCFSEQSTISLAHSGKLQGALLVELWWLTACIVAECIFGDRFVWQFLVDFLDNFLERFWTVFFWKSTISLAHSGQLQGAYTIRPSTADCLHCIFGDRFVWQFWTDFEQILNRYWTGGFLNKVLSP